jgi:hypothetical protein
LAGIGDLEFGEFAGRHRLGIWCILYSLNHKLAGGAKIFSKQPDKIQLSFTTLPTTNRIIFQLLFKQESIKP